MHIPETFNDLLGQLNMEFEYTTDRESSYSDAIPEDEPNYMGTMRSNGVRSKCIWFAKKHNVPLVYFPEFDADDSIYYIIKSMNVYLYHTDKLVKTVMSMDISPTLKSRICQDIAL